MKNNGFFWISYSDLMTSMFFIMLVLFVITIINLKQKMGILEKNSQKLGEIKNIENALKTIDPQYFKYDSLNQRYRLEIDANFHPNSSNMLDIHLNKRLKIKNAGEELYNKIKSVINNNSSVYYLLVIEGNTQRYNRNWETNPDIGYKKSYERALALVNYWKNNGIDFRKLGKQCELIIAGSGYFSQSRDPKYEWNNRKFTIQVTTKIGKYLNKVNNR